MFNWKTHLEQILGGLANTHGTAPLGEVKRILQGVLGVEEIRLFGPQGAELSDDLALQQARGQLWDVSVRVQCAPAAARPDAAAPGGAESRFREGSSAPPPGDIGADQRYEAFLREFVRLEQRHEFMWAGYIVRELLPRLGFPAEEAKVVLDRLRAENLVTMTKVPNPKNPDFPATGVQLNREHPRVKALLGTPSVNRNPPRSPEPQPVASSDAEKSG